MRVTEERSAKDLAAAEPSPPTAYIIEADKDTRGDAARILAHADLANDLFRDVEEFLDVHEPDWPGCIVLEFQGHKTRGAEHLEQLRAAGVVLPVVIVSWTCSPPVAIALAKLGALDYVVKPADSDALIASVRAAMAVDAQRRADAAGVDRVRGVLASLSPREAQVLRLVMAGATNREVAATLGLAVSTVENHRAKVMAKTGADNIVELVRIAMAVPAISGRHFPAELAATGTHLGRLPEAIGGAA